MPGSTQTSPKPRRRLLPAWLEAAVQRRTLHHIDGVIDGLGGGMLRGWGFQPREPRRRLLIAAETGGRLTFGRADLYRADVHRADVGSDGYCGFAISLSAVGGPTRVLIAEAGSLRHLATVRGEPRVPDRFERHGYLCFALDPGAARLAGWLSSATRPSDRRRIVLEVDGEVACSQVACLYRRASSACAEDGFHGFSIAVPAAGRTIRLVDAVSGRQLHVRRR